MRYLKARKLLPQTVFSLIYAQYCTRFSASNRNEYQEYFLGVKAAGAQGWQSYRLHVPIALKSGSLNLLEPSGPVQACNGITQPLPWLYNFRVFNPLNTELNSICYLLALLAHHFLHVSRIRVKSLTIRLLMSYIYGAPILDVSRSHTTTHHSR